MDSNDEFKIFSLNNACCENVKGNDFLYFRRFLAASLVSHAGPTFNPQSSIYKPSTMQSFILGYIT
jgi:hypothetical protein